MLRKTMIALCAVASVAMLAPSFALARGGGGGHGGGGFGGGHGGFSGGVGGFGGRGFSGGNVGGSFAHAAPVATAGVAAVQGGRFAAGNFGHGRFDHGFRGRRFGFVGPYYDGYWDTPDYAYDDSYYDNGICYVVQQRVHTAYGWRVWPVQVCG